MTLVVLAAGMGSRYGGLKQIDPVGVNGEFIIDYSIYDAIKAGYDKVVFIIKRENYEMFRDTIGKRIENVAKVAYAFQEIAPEHKALVPADRVKPLGTAHALLCAREHIKGAFAVINSDDYYGREAFRLAAEYLRASNTTEDSHFCMVGYGLSNTLTEHGTVSRGICQVKTDGMLTSITERTKIKKMGKDAAFLENDEWHPLSGDSVASMNFFGFTDRIFEYAEQGLEKFLRNPSTDLLKGEYYLPLTVSDCLATGACDMKVLVTPDQWFGVTYQEDRPMVVESLRRLTEIGVYPKEGLWK
jgi:choline kinase